MKPIRIFRHEDWIKAGHLTETLEDRGVPYELIAIDNVTAANSSSQDCPHCSVTSVCNGLVEPLVFSQSGAGDVV